MMIVGLCMPTARAASEEKQGGHWYSFFWPLGEHVPVEALKEEYVPFQGEGEIPYRPKLHMELGDGFLETRKLHPRFKVPVL